MISLVLYRYLIFVFRIILVFIGLLGTIFIHIKIDKTFLNNKFYSKHPHYHLQYYKRHS